MTTKDPTTDCPPCPKCGMELGTPIKEAEIEAWNGPPNANLFCPSCGEGWKGSRAHLSQAVASWKAYEESLK